MTLPGVPHSNKTNRFLAALGAALREQRERVGWSQEDLGFEAEIDRTYVSGVERGVRNPTIANLLKVCKALGVRPSQVLRQAEDRARFEP